MDSLEVGPKIPSCVSKSTNVLARFFCNIQCRTGVVIQHRFMQRGRKDREVAPMNICKCIQWLMTIHTTWAHIARQGRQRAFFERAVRASNPKCLAAKSWRPAALANINALTYDNYNYIVLASFPFEFFFLDFIEY